MARRCSLILMVCMMATLLAGCGNPHYTGELEPLDLVGMWTAQVRHEGQVLDSWLKLKADGTFHGERIPFRIPLREGPSVSYVSTNGLWEVNDVSYLGRSYLPRWHLHLRIPFDGGHLWHILREDLPNVMLAYDLDLDMGTRLVFRRANRHIRDLDEGEAE